MKPSSQVPLTQNYLTKLVDEAGFPPGVLNLVNGSHEVSDTLMEHPKVKGISFVGSSPVAKYIYKHSAEYGKRVQAQGGAKNSLVVMPDAVLDRTVQNMLASYYGCAGQRCLAGSNMIAVGSIADPLLKKWVEGTKRIKMGYGLDESVNMGPVVSAKAKKKVLEYIDGAEKEGAKIIVDGRKSKVPGYEKGHFIGPTVVDQVTPDMTIAKDEVFGPVVSFLRMNSMDEAIEFIHKSPFGNAASVYTESYGNSVVFSKKTKELSFQVYIKLLNLSILLKLFSFFICYQNLPGKGIC